MFTGARLSLDIYKRVRALYLSSSTHSSFALPQPPSLSPRSRSWPSSHSRDRIHLRIPRCTTAPSVTSDHSLSLARRCLRNQLARTKPPRLALTNLARAPAISTPAPTSFKRHTTAIKTRPVRKSPRLRSSIARWRDRTPVRRARGLRARTLSRPTSLSSTSSSSRRKQGGNRGHLKVRASIDGTYRLAKPSMKMGFCNE
ncbi:hypothetical protein BDY17DRAFT_47117 [Neohortaea acidophila]|uniref:Uncharacterized protein n=1 Tax=Neohortaea acidophila TaxID=245834 RepID=A0A6A6PH09_9PEZI|nr:uncharacterized protein BDY17DRAFT_47117 [Neohortaea acidophila]KAF2479004.1 hypothetical protein BDY17DRAFT_47117 [Neohortaea acidophila]